MLSLPLLFAGGLPIFDTLDGFFMNFAYGWAFARPVRKVYYNLVISGLSIAVALLIGTIEIGGVVSDKLGLHGGIWGVAANFNINDAGYIVVGLFIAVWLTAVAYWRVARVEARWSGSSPRGTD